MGDDLPISAFGSCPSGDAAERSEDRSRSDLDLGDLVITLLAGTLAGLRDRLERDGFHDASALVDDLTLHCDGFLAESPG